MAASALQIRPLSPAIGAEIYGVDLTRPLDEDDWAAIHGAFLEHLVIFFRDQPLTPEQHLAFARRFGTLEPYPFVDGIPGHPELIEIVKMPDEVGNFGGSWHTDMSFRARPPLGAVLWARQVPEAGGDTMFANMYLAYESLSPGLQALLRDLKAVHDSFEPARHSDPVKYKGMHSRAKAGERESHVQPLVRVHPETGRAALYISPYYTTRIEGMTEDESRPLLDFLADHSVKPEFTCRFNWSPYFVAV